MSYESTSAPHDPVFSPALSPDEGVAAATALFHEAFDCEPDGVWYAPGRVNVIGEHTDYNGGLALPIALPHRAHMALRRREDRTIRLVSPQTRETIDVLDLDQIGPKGTPGEVRHWNAYVAGVAWALEQDGLGPVSGFDAALYSCVPLGGGLSSSAALEGATVVALDEVNALGLAGSAEEPNDAGRERLVTSCVRAENEMAGAPTGGMDQSASLRCQAGHALELDCRSGQVRQVPLDLAGAGLALLVIDTKAKHSHADGQYGSRRAACEKAASLLGVDLLVEVSPEALPQALERLEASGEDGAELVKRTRHVVTEIQRTKDLVALLSDGQALAGDKLAEVGTLLNASHDSLRDDYECTCPELDVAVDAARAAGAYGARMTGGGFGGSAIALVDADAVEQVARAVVQAYAREGFGAPAFLDAVPSAPAGRLA
ncbi:galactokinase [Actinomyces urogenitalis DSM 15434]|uniref:Galactokinase n=1 Tax=Actinomyces urogenitalis DSM 15434 TaxID=525246 RepID=C0W6V3_9ACTO|nr:galactokinase [Actinomyces urogenitalis]EEH65627.1 galactokinase [Actinomyces urogenitalis DSM 15434]MBS5976670.1 galactokinase [Actinomyces urogenitalis]MDK8237817.1 galactokinase [Actinomyces urogenitalis]MDU0864019.1 galactokinase [Actinomyces urogenitalis]MDU0874490.1 galactokinase [Actinomyces urogenitalis]